MKEFRKTLMIGIAGVSRAGKTELAKFLCQKFKALGYHAVSIHQDEYVFSKSHIPKIQDRIDWENPESINSLQYLSAIHAAKQNGAEVIIAEGFLNFHNHEMVKLFDKKVFLEIRRSTFEKRKAYDTRWDAEPDWYIDHIWKSYERYGKTILESNSDFLRIYGENRMSYPAVWNYVASDLKGKLDGSTQNA